MQSPVLVRALVGVTVLGLAGGCHSLGPCDEAKAKTVVYDPGGLPAYEGQAILNTSCGQGAFCHSPDAKGVARFGAPAKLDFYEPQCGDATSSTACDKYRAELAQVHQTVLAYKLNIDSEISAGRMPPGGMAGRQTAPRPGTGYALPDGTPVPLAATPEGQTALRNWLSCGAPVVERTTPGPTTIGDVVPSM